MAAATMGRLATMGLTLFMQCIESIAKVARVTHTIIEARSLVAAKAAIKFEAICIVT